jgi:1,4-dihydroxy-2-naphthoate octaprenyltransferase
MKQRKERLDFNFVYFGLIHLPGNNLQNSTPKWLIWTKAARLRTLPLAFSGTGLGSFLAWKQAHFQPIVAIFLLLTTLCLQVLSNFANDLGDSIHGADHAKRMGPARAVQSGDLSKGEMKKAVYLMASLSFFFGMVLLYFAFAGDWTKILLFIGLGVAAISAAYFYTNGKKPYGYFALGDVFVFTFFGIVAVAGSYFLYTQNFKSTLFFPSLAIGFWSTAVLNINNMRDMESDSMAGKLTIPILLKKENALKYHGLLVLAGFLSFGYFIFQNEVSFLFSIPGMLMILKSFFLSLIKFEPKHLDKQLKPQALGTFLSVLGLWLGAILI